MAIYHLHVSIISRKKGRSAVAAAAYRSANKLHNENDNLTHDYLKKSNIINSVAYRSGEKIQNEKNGKIFDYTKKRGVVHTKILLPKNAPKEYKNRSTLCNAVEKSENRKDAQTARDIDIALPIEFDRQEQIEVSRQYVKDNFINKGMIADIAIHDKQDGNPHAHILLTTREVTKTGFSKKNRDWNNKNNLNLWRENWANICNEKLQQKEIVERIDHRTLKVQGIDREPQIHVGVSAKYIEQKGIVHDRAKKNREIIKRNNAKEPEKIAEKLHEIKKEHFNLDKKITVLQQTASETKREINILRIKAKEIAERAEHIKITKDKIIKFKANRYSIGFFDMGKNNIDNQIKQLERSHEQAIGYFKRTYKFEPEQAIAEIERIEKTANSKNNLYEKLQDRLKPLIKEKEQFVFEYQKQKLLIDIRHDKEKIYKRLEELEKENRLHMKSVQDDIRWSKCERTLDIIVEHNFEQVLKHVTPEQTKKLLERLERKKARERSRIR